MARRICAGAVLAVLALIVVTSVAVAGSEKRVVVKMDASGDHEKITIEGNGGAWLGVGIQELDRDLREAMDIDSDIDGVLITSIYDDSPAEDAGLEDGDVIVAFDGKRVDDVDELVKMVRSHEPGDTIEVTVVRDGKKKAVKAKLSEREHKAEMYWYDDEGLKGLEGLKALQGLEGLAGLEHFFIPQMTMGMSGGGGRGRLGVYVDDLSEGLAEYFEVPDGKGILIEGIVEDSPAEKAGIKAGDVIIRIGDVRVGDTAELIEAISDMEADEETPVALVRKGRERTVMVTVKESEYEKLLKRTFTIDIDDGDGEHTILIEGLDEEEAEELKEELEELREELKELRDELDDMKDD